MGVDTPMSWQARSYSAHDGGSLLPRAGRTTSRRKEPAAPPYITNTIIITTNAIVIHHHNDTVTTIVPSPRYCHCGHAPALHAMPPSAGTQRPCWRSSQLHSSTVELAVGAAPSHSGMPCEGSSSLSLSWRVTCANQTAAHDHSSSRPR